MVLYVLAGLALGLGSGLIRLNVEMLSHHIFFHCAEYVYYCQHCYYFELRHQVSFDILFKPFDLSYFALPCIFKTASDLTSENSIEFPTLAI